MILSDRDILEIQRGDNPLIDPFDATRLRGASYDVLLDGVITPVRERPGVVDLSRQEDVDSIYPPQVSIEGFVMKPGQYCLASLAETVALPGDLVAFVEPRTRYTRMGLLVVNQFCNPGYRGRLQIGLFNASGNNLRLSSYLSIAQLVFHRLSRAASAERLYDRQESAAYHGEASFIGGRAESPLPEEDRKRYEALLADLSKYELK